VVPHLDSPEHPETELLSRVAAQYESERLPYWPLTDGQALLVDGSDVVTTAARCTTAS
jgi:dipeptidase E